MMNLSCCVWALTLPEKEILEEMKAIGFDWVDIQPQMLQTEELRSTATALNLKISCVGASFNMPDGANLDDLSETNRQQAIDHVYQSIDHTVDLGADTVYVIPGMDSSPAALAQFALSMKTISEQASTRSIKVCIEHFPGRALSTATDTLEFIAEINHPNLYLLFDSGHIQMAGEDPSEIILKAGSKLGYVHFDDNDGENDFHWSLLDGVMTEDDLHKTFQALQDIGYEGAVSLELSPNLPSPKQSLINSRDILLNIMGI
jgi:sugar phosphate isomerase/epimerase